MEKWNILHDLLHSMNKYLSGENGISVLYVYLFLRRDNMF